MLMELQIQAPYKKRKAGILLRRRFSVHFSFFSNTDRPSFGGIILYVNGTSNSGSMKYRNIQNIMLKEVHFWCEGSKKANMEFRNILCAVRRFKEY